MNKIFVYRWASFNSRNANRAIFFIGSPENRSSVRCTSSIPANQREADKINRELNAIAHREIIEVVPVIGSDSDAQPQQLIDAPLALPQQEA